MKKLILVSILYLFFFFPASAQFRLDVAGDAKISGKISLIKTQGDSSLFIGPNAGNNDDGNNDNVFIGKNAGNKNTSGKYNTFHGHHSGANNTTGEANTFIGYGTGKFTTKSFLTFIGFRAGESNTTGFSNTFIGAYAGTRNTEGAGNLFVGSSAGTRNTTGAGNVIMGSFSGDSNTQGNENVFIGSETGRDNTLGSKNIFIGGFAGGNNIEGNFNTYIGYGTGKQNQHGEHNTYLGSDAGQRNNLGASNTFLGAQAGHNTIKGSKNTFIGQGADIINTPTDSLERSIAIGYQAKVACHNCAIIGGTQENAVRVGIGVNTTWSDLHIKQSSTTPGNSGVRLEYKTNGKHWNTYIDAVDDYNFRYNDALKGYIKDEDGMYTIPSDGRLKKKIENIGTTLDKVMRLRPVKYFYKNAARGKYKTHGFIAQEVEKIFPAFVSEKDGFKALAYDNFAIISIKAIQELKHTIDQQKEAINQQQETVNELKSEIVALRLILEQLMTPAKPEEAIDSEIHSNQKASLSQNAPNPVHQRTQINYFIPPNVKNVLIQLGTGVGQILDRYKITNSGSGNIVIDTSRYAEGTYYYTLVIDGQVVSSKKMMVVHP